MKKKNQLIIYIQTLASFKEKKIPYGEEKVVNKVYYSI